MDLEGKTVALVVAAGSGSRSGGDVPKQYRNIAGKAVLSHAIDHLAHPAIDAVQVVIGEGQQALYQRAIGNRALPAPVLGSAARQGSVRNGLEALAARGTPALVLIHDAARPFTPPSVVDRLLEALKSAPGAVPVLTVADSLARSGPALGDPVGRDGLVRVQTPQAFRFADILAAHRGWVRPGEATDDAQVMRAAGGTVATVAGDSRLEKLTFAEDFSRAAEQLRATMTRCTGFGFDAHQFTEGDHVWLGGVQVQHARGLEGHSDADVVLHALCDAVLGAAGEGDIGDHFPPSDPRWRDAASSGFVTYVRDLVADRGGRIDHVDVTIICEAPRIGPHKQAMRETIAGLLRLPLSRVSIKATTTEGLGFTGRREGIAAQAVATVAMPGDNDQCG